MIRRLVYLLILTACILTRLSAQDYSILETSFENALTAVPTSYKYHEESGALIFVQKKDYSFDIRSTGDGYESVVTYSSTQNEKPKAEDPRPPVREGDRAFFLLRRLLAAADIFAATAEFELSAGGIETIGGRRYRLTEVAYKITDEEGRLWPVTGKLLVDQHTGIPFRLQAEQCELPDDVYCISFEVDFEGRYSSSCSISEYRTYQKGQFGVFRYFYNTVLTFNY